MNARCPVAIAPVQAAKPLGINVEGSRVIDGFDPGRKRLQRRDDVANDGFGLVGRDHRGVQVGHEIACDGLPHADVQTKRARTRIEMSDASVRPRIVDDGDGHLTPARFLPKRAPRTRGALL